MDGAAILKPLCSAVVGQGLPRHSRRAQGSCTQAVTLLVFVDVFSCTFFCLSLSDTDNVHFKVKLCPRTTEKLIVSFLFVLHTETVETHQAQI